MYRMLFIYKYYKNEKFKNKFTKITSNKFLKHLLFSIRNIFKYNKLTKHLLNVIYFLNFNTLTLSRVEVSKTK